MVSFAHTPEAQRELMDAIRALSEFELPEKLKGLRRLIPPAGAEIADITVTFVERERQPLSPATPFRPVVIQGPPLSSTVIAERR